MQKKKLFISFLLMGCLILAFSGCESVPENSSTSITTTSTEEDSVRVSSEEIDEKDSTSSQTINTLLNKESPNLLMSLPLDIKKHKTNAMEAKYACMVCDENRWQELTQEDIREFALAVAETDLTTITIDLSNGYAFNFSPATVDSWQYGEYDMYINNRFQLETVDNYYLFENGVYHHVPLDYEVQ